MIQVLPLPLAQHHSDTLKGSPMESLMHTTSRVETIERTDRPWGWYETVSQMPGHKVKRIHVFPGHRLSLQKHDQRAEHWVVVRGTARVHVGGLERDLAQGEHIDIPLGAVHRLTNLTTEPVEIVEVQFGTHLGEDDIVRIQDDYGRS